LNNRANEISEVLQKQEVKSEEDELLEHTNMWHKAQVHHMNTERSEAFGIFQNLVKNARKANSRRRLVDSLPFLALCLTTDGHIEESIPVYIEALEIYDGEMDCKIGNINGTDPKCHSHLNLALALAISGKNKEAQEHIDESLSWALSINHGFSQALTLCYQMYILALGEDKEKILSEETNQEQFFNENQEFNFLYSYSKAIIDWARGENKFQIEFSKNRLETGQTYLHSFYELLLAMTYFDTGNKELAVSILTKAIDWCEISGEKAFVNIMRKKLTKIR
jgi:tetratricopeptide (TPR) repeat protein